jgi:hypothetical protein
MVVKFSGLIMAVAVGRVKFSLAPPWVFPYAPPTAAAVRFPYAPPPCCRGFSLGSTPAAVDFPFIVPALESRVGWGEVALAAF